MADAEAASDNADEERRRAELRKAGEQYFQKLLAEADKGKKDPLAPPPPRRRSHAVDLEAPFDADLEAVGAVLKGSRLYVLGALYIVCQGASWVLLKGALGSLPAPALMVFLHSLPPAGLLLFLHRWSGSALDLGPLNLRTLTGALPSATLHGLQILAAFAALRGGSVYLLLGWTAFLPPLLQAQLRLLHSGGNLLMAQRAGLGSGVVGLLLVLLFGHWPGVLCLLCLAAWGALAAARLAWPTLRQRAQAGEIFSYGRVTSQHIQDAAAAEDSLSAAQCAFYDAALPAVPAVVLGIVCLEGRQLVDHELSVPAVSEILLSMAAWGVFQVAGLMVLERASADARPQPRLALGAASAAVTLLLQLTVVGGDRAGALLGAAAAVGGAIVLELPPR